MAKTCLTATPFGTSKHDINGLLSLLPSPPVATTSEAMWAIRQLNETIDLALVTVLGRYHVLQMASERGDAEPDGRLYIAMPDGARRYLPRRIESYLVEFALPLSRKFAEAFEQKAFKGKTSRMIASTMKKTQEGNA